MTVYPFLVQFTNRLAYLTSSAFGHARSIKSFDSASGSSASGRISRRKVKVDRKGLVDGLIKIMKGTEHFSILEVEFINEVGTGLGPTLEYFALVSAALRLRKGIKWNNIQHFIWRHETETSGNEFVSFNGVYPAPESNLEILDIFANLGKFTAKSILDSRTLDLIFNAVFLEQVFSPGRFTVNMNGLRVIKSLL